MRSRISVCVAATGAHVAAAACALFAPSAFAQATATPAGGVSGTEAVPAQPPTEETIPANQGPASYSGPVAPTTDEWKFSWNGYFRAPMRIGLAKRDNPGPGQSNRTLHSPFLTDDQYLNWNYTRQWEKDWSEVFFNYGNSKVTGTVGFGAYNLTDAGTQDPHGQFGLQQAYVTWRPDAKVDHLRIEVKVGSFWNKYGMAGKYDAGKYDTYVFGRTHTMGELVGLEYDVSDFTFKISEGFGTRGEQANIGTAPTVGTTGFTLLSHFHGGIAYKNFAEIGLHYLTSWCQDARVEGPGDQGADGQVAITGVEGRLNGGVLGYLWVGYSHVKATHEAIVGPAIEVLHSLNTDATLNMTNQFFGGRGDGTLNTLSVQYDYSFGTLWRKIQNPNSSFWGDGPDVILSLFGMYTTVSSPATDPATGAALVNPMTGRAWDGVKKLKFGTDLVAFPFAWLGAGFRYDKVQPDVHDSSQSFWVISPKIVFRSAFITHEEITVQYSKYTYGTHVYPQPPNGPDPGSAPTATAQRPDENVFGVKATMWW